MGWSENEGDEEADEVYCICRTSDSDRFMIGCDHCEEWYHGDCINVTEREARKIKRFFCDICRKKNPGLKIKYKDKHKTLKEGEKDSKQDEKIEKQEKHDKLHKKEKQERDDKPEKDVKHESQKKHDKPHKSGKSDKTDKTEKPSKHEKHSKGEKIEASEKIDPNEKAQQVDKPEKHNRPEKEHKNTKQKKSEKRDKSEKRNQSGKHDNFDKQRKKVKRDKTDKGDKVEKNKPEKQDKPDKREKSGKEGKSEKPEKPAKGGKHNDEKQESTMRQDKKKTVKSEKVDASAGLSVKPEQTDKVEDLVKVEKCMESNDQKSRESTDLDERMDFEERSDALDREMARTENESHTERHGDTTSSKSDRPSRPPEQRTKRRRSTSEADDLSEEQGTCGRCTGCLSGEGSCRKRPSVAPPACDSPPAQRPSEPPPADPAVLRESNRVLPSEEPTPLYRTVRRRSTVGRRRRGRTSSDADMLSVEHESSAITRQCCGPQCVNACRPGSRYCSDECGLNLARNRIFQVLPQRIQEWNMTRCVAEDTNMRTLEKIRRQQQTAQAQLEKLQRSHAELDRLVERGRRATVDPDALEEDIDEEQHSIHCVTCGHEVLTRNAVRHMEKCFAKYESQTSFGSLYQTRVEGFNMFCDFYNRTQRTYCKRLRVLCPEHWRPPPVGDDEVCGCPLVSDVFQPTGRFCRAPQKRCRRHPAWERLRRAELDMERVRWAMRMDELLEQERQCRQSMAQRAGVLALLLHSTYDHEVMEKVAHQQKKMAASKMRSRPG